MPFPVGIVNFEVKNTRICICSRRRKTSYLIHIVPNLLCETNKQSSGDTLQRSKINGSLGLM